jgi:predicted GIY-YIG superfamily endonuclease
MQIPIMFIVYALYNKKHDKIYIGQSINIEERIRLHMKREKSLKTGFGRKYIKNRVVY